jgi:hypothetical protein
MIGVPGYTLDIVRSGYSYVCVITLKHVFRANFETFTAVLALRRVYLRKVHAKHLVQDGGNDPKKSMPKV